MLSRRGNQRCFPGPLRPGLRFHRRRGRSFWRSSALPVTESVSVALSSSLSLDTISSRRRLSLGHFGLDDSENAAPYTLERQGIDVDSVKAGHPLAQSHLRF